MDLKPCPFCGKTESLELWDGCSKDDHEFDAKGNESTFAKAGYTVCVVCSFNHGGCGASGGFHLTVDGAMNQWNKRT